MTNDEKKQPSAPADSNSREVNASEAPAPKKAEAKAPASHSKDKPSGGASGASRSNAKKATDSDYVHSSTAEDPSKKGNKSSQKGSPQKQTKNADSKQLSANMPSSRPAHRVIPYLLFGLAAFFGICMILNLFCNLNNQCANDPSAHLLGSVGYWICYVLFGSFGAAAFLIPVLMVNMAIYWKDFIDNKLTLEKSLVSVLLLLFFGAFIHSFSFIQLPEDQWRRSAAELMRLGAELRGGGVIGGGLGYFLAKYMNWLGALILGFFLTVLTAFFFLGLSPRHLFQRIRASIKNKKEKKSENEKADTKPTKTKKERSDEPEQDSVPAEKQKRRVSAKAEKSLGEEGSEDDGLAPMPMPVLDASDDTPVNNLYVPADIGKTMRPGVPMRQKPTAAPSNGRAPQTGAVPPVPPNRTAQQAPRGDSMESVFPRSPMDAKNVKRAQKDDQNFELGNIFIDLDDGKQKRVKAHAPLPPEAPLPSSGTAPRRAPGSPEASGARPMQTPNRGTPTGQRTAARPMNPTAGNPRPASPNGRPTITVRPATAPAGITPSANAPTAPRNGQKPIFRPSEKASNTEYGLSSEEFEKREANAQAIAKATASTTAKNGKSVAKPAASDGKKAPAASKKEENKTKGTAATASSDSANKPYIFPPISYLHPSEPMTAENHSEIKANMEKLYATLNDFNVRINEITYSCGPTVTRYEIYPSAGVRVRTITNLADDIALSFAVQSVRMEAIPGKSAIGVEVPNTTRQTVFLRELLESRAFTEKPSRLTAGLGADVAGAPLLFDIAKMPHLLVAGATGMGKSVCINCIIMSILFKARPDQVKLILVDPKKVEFSLYKGIPHLMAPIIVTPKDAAGALQAAVNEMEDRFTKIQDVGVSNIEGYNKAADKDPDLPHMPHIVIIIDELADLMLTARDEVEDSICRLAQKARAAGMHIIVGTQRPSVDVVTGLIKSNIPSRVACTVASQVDSRTILDIAGAEKLLGKGDMLFAPVGSMKPTRVQGAFVSDAEVEKICEFIRATNGTAVYNEAFTSKMKEYSAMCGNKKNKNAEGGAVSLPGESGDNKYVDAIRISIEENRVSTSLLQRKLGIGYSRAAKIIDRMEEEGLVSKPDGSKPRNILISAEQFIERYIEGDAGAEDPDGEE